MIDTQKLRDIMGDPAKYMTHFEDCIYEKEHARCAVLALCDEVDRLRGLLVPDYADCVGEVVKVGDVDCPHNNDEVMVFEDHRIWRCLDCGRTVRLK